MATTSFTTRIDSELKAELEAIARLENRSASFMANQAIRSLVEERRATNDLIALGLDMIKQGAATIDAGDIHAWLLTEDDSAPFPAARPRL